MSAKNCARLTRTLALFFAALGYVERRVALGHPICVDSSAPKSYDATNAFCSGSYATWSPSEGRCCTQATDNRIRRKITNGTYPQAPDKAACAPLLAQALCSACNPFAGHIYSYRGRLCGSFFDQLNASCGMEVLYKYTFFKQQPDNFYCLPFPTTNYYTEAQLNLVPAFANLTGKLPKPMIGMQFVPGLPSPGKWWGIGQPGSVVEWSNTTTAASVITILKLKNIAYNTQGENGLLGLAFSPQYQENSNFFLYYCEPSSTAAAGFAVRISRFTRVQPASETAAAISAAAAATLASELKIWSVDEPFGNHQGGWIGFGPEGCLYLAIGDGGSSNDPLNNSQSLTEPYGKILRFNVSASSSTQLYAIPPTNPFGSLVWAYGLRNPWQCAFDRVKQRLWCGDVGQAAVEEVNVIQMGNNYGWKLWEGNHATAVGAPEETPPVYAYCHDATEAGVFSCDTAVVGATVIGGRVYRGQKYATWLAGKYIFADMVSRSIVALTYDEVSGSGTPTVLLDSGIAPVAFGEDSLGELYVAHYSSTEISPTVYQFRCGPVCGEPATLP